MATVSDETLRALIAELRAGRSAGTTPGPDATSTEKMEAAMKNIKSDAKAIGDLFGTYADSLMGGSREFDLIAKSTLNVGTNIVRMTKEIETWAFGILSTDNYEGWLEIKRISFKVNLLSSSKRSGLAATFISL